MTDRSATPASSRIQPMAALRALRALLRDPDDTAKVFDVIEALSGPTRTRVLRKFRKRPNGPALLEARPDLLARLSDREALLALPPGSLGRTYAEFMNREQIDADGLVEASEEQRNPNASPEERWFGDRLRDMHDLWHVVTGYERDLVGEAALLAFTYAQTRNPGIGLIVAAAYWKAKEDSMHARPVIRDGYRRGRDAAWLPEQRWEDLLEQPLEAVRAQLRLGAPPEYAQVRSEGAPALAS
ncbi:MAG: Coq4 family protein [Myxococcota bacterium]